MVHRVCYLGSNYGAIQYDERKENRVLFRRGQGKEDKTRCARAIDGVFIPVPDHVIMTETGQRMTAKKSAYARAEGDLITVEVYSNGVHMLKNIEDPNSA